MNILVTGGAGFIGSHTVVALSEAGFTPIIVDDFSNAPQSVLEGLRAILNKPVLCYEGNCGDPALMRTIFEKHAIGGIIHFAASKAVGESMQMPLKYYRNNIVNLISLLELALENKVSNFIFSSSCTVYGVPEQLPVTETSPVLPAESVYGNTKQIGEEILHDSVRAGLPLKVCALRYFNPIGAHPSGLIGELPTGVPSNLVPYVTQTGAGQRKELTIFGDDYDTPDGTCIRDYIHVMDLAEAHVQALRYQIDSKVEHQYDIFNIGTGQGASVLEIVNTFESVSGKKLPYRIGPRRPGDIPAIFADAARARAVLGWAARRNIRQALEDAWRWQKNLSQDSQ